MPYSIEAQQFGMKKEATRLTAEAAPDAWIALDKASGFEYVAEIIEDEALRALKANYPPVAGIKNLSGKLLGPVRASDMGEVLQMLLGNPTSAQQAATAAYKHTYNESATVQLPTYTFFHERSLDVFESVGVGCKKVAFDMPVDGPLRFEAEMIGISENDGGDIGTPSYAESSILTMQNCDFKIAGTSNTNVMAWNLSIDNGLIAKRALSKSQNAQDVVAVGPNIVEGGFSIFFENVTERNKFLANTTTTIQILVEGATIASTYKYTVDINLYDVRYTAFPYGDENGLLAAQVSFKAFYATGSSKQMQIDLTNINTAY